MDIAAAHHEALSTLLPRADLSAAVDYQHILDLAGKFLAECLSPFVMAQRGFQETIAALKSLNEHLEDEVELRTRALRESEALYRTLIQATPDGITVTDLQGRITLSNHQAALLHGFQDPEDEVGVDAGQFVATEDIARVRKISQHLLQTGSIQPVEYTLVNKNGVSIPVEARVTLMSDPEGKPASFVGVIRDITQRKEAELKLQIKARQQAVVAALGQLALGKKSIEELMQETVRLVTHTLEVELCELLEMSPDSNSLVLRDGVGWKEGSIGVRVVRADSNSQAGYTLLSAGPVIVEDLAHESRFKPPPFLLDHGVVSGVTVIVHSDNQPYGVLGAHTTHHRVFTVDESNFLQSMANTLAMAISNRRLLESEAARRETAERTSEERLRSMAIVNHELRTPLASIKGFATTLLADDVVWSPEDQLDFIRTINEEADKLSNLIEQIMDISKMGAGKAAVACTKQPLSNIIGHVSAQINALTGQHELVLDIPLDLPDVVADTQRTGQVLVNLVENATKYSPPQSRITVLARSDSDFVSVSVADQGPGILPEDRKVIFQPFFRSENPVTSKSKGAGLGLHICQRLVEAQGGRIGIQEHDGPGATFVFTLPVATSEGKRKN